jgi:hypothetical protein
LGGVARGLSPKRTGQLEILAAYRSGRFSVKHVEKILFAICLAFYAWGFIDERFRQWAMIGGYSTFIAFIINVRKRKGQPRVDFSVVLMIAGVIVLFGLQIADSIRG